MRSSGLAPYIRDDAVADDDSYLVGEGGVVRAEVREHGREQQTVTVAVLQAFALQGGSSRGRAQQESPSAHVARSPQQVRETVEAEHGVVDEERHHGLAPGRIRGARGSEARHRAGLGDALLQDLTVGGLLVAEQQFCVDRLVALATRRVDLVATEQRVDPERARLVGDDRHDSATDARDRATGCARAG